MGDEPNHNIYDKYSDKEILHLYRSNPKPEYIEVMIKRYRRLLLSAISKWHLRNTHLNLTTSDMKDIMQYSYLALILFMNNTKNIDTIKSVPVRIRSYQFYILDKYYGYRRREYTTADDELEPLLLMFPAEHSGFITKNNQNIFSIVDYWLYLIYAKKYNYYKAGMMFLGCTSRKALSVRFNRLKKKKLAKCRRQLDK